MHDKNKKIKIAFFGSSEFSIPTFEYFLEDGDIDVVSLITLPPAVKNRGKKLSNNIVHDFALQKNFPEKNIYTPEKLRNNNEILSILMSQNLDFIIVVAYGKIITQEIINIPKYEILNLHPSALPKYRGAAPIERAIENGENEIDICIMKVESGLDTGDVAVRKKYVLDLKKGAKEIVPDVAKIGGKLMLETIKKCIKNEIFFMPQMNSENMELYAKKIDKSELFIDLSDKNLNAKRIFNKIRAFNNSGCCYFKTNDNQRIKIISCEMENHDNSGNSRLGFNKENGFLYFADGIIKPIIVQKEGGKPMYLKDYLNGLR